MFPGQTYVGAPVTGDGLLSQLPEPLAAILTATNGLVAFDGGLHIRGVVDTPAWHSLGRAWKGDDALHVLYPVIDEGDVPFGQDAVGDQWLLRGDHVIRLEAEIGEIEALDMSLAQFLDAVMSDPVETLGLHPLIQFRREGGTLLPGQLLSVWPPFCSTESADGVSLRAVPAEERIRFLADFARQLPPEGSFRVSFT